MRTFDLSPFYRSTVGFDRLFSLLDSNLAAEAQTYPERPIRMIVASPKDVAGGKVSRSFHVRTDLVGKVTKFDGDHFIVDFTRPPDPHIATPRRK